MASMVPIIVIPSLCIGALGGYLVYIAQKGFGSFKLAVVVSAAIGALLSWGVAEVLTTYQFSQSAKRQFGDKYCMIYKDSAIGMIANNSSGVASWDGIYSWHAKIITPNGYFHYSFVQEQWEHHEYGDSGYIVSGVKQLEKRDTNKEFLECKAEKRK